jgi:hypothetical protein
VTGLQIVIAVVAGLALVGLILTKPFTPLERLRLVDRLGGNAPA